jgi:hypothetical protein
MHGGSFDYPTPPADLEDEDGRSTYYHIHNPYNLGRMMRWLTNFDNVQDEEVTILPHSSLPTVPERSQISRRPKSFREVNLSKRSNITADMTNRMEADIDAKKSKKLVPAWGIALKKVKKRQHLANLRKNGHKSTTKEPARPTAYRTKKARVLRALLANKLLSTRSIEAFMKLPVRQRLAKYQDTLEAPGMIKISDSAFLDTDLQTHCVDSIPNKHARSLLDASAHILLPPNYLEVWREAQRHFWRNNVFVVNAIDIKAVLNGFNARVKSYIGMLHVDLETLDDMDNLTRHDSSHVDNTSSRSLQAIRQQNQDLRRLISECYNLTWMRVHVHSEWMQDEIHDLIQAHRRCKASTGQNRGCRHIRRYKELCMNTQRRVEHLLWLLYKSLKCREGTVFIDVEQLGFDGITKIFEVQIDHENLDEIDEKIRVAWKEQREGEKKERSKDSHARRVPAVKKVDIEVIDLT